MPLLNYTTSVAAPKTAAEMQQLLAKAGARQVMVEYDADGAPEGLAFTIMTAHGVRSFVLPCDPAPVEKVLRAQRVERRYQTREQATRVAWRITKDWLEAQLALIATQMVALDQVMLPYMTDDDGRTVYQLYVAGVEKFALPPGGD
jgi:hypothetical protein